ncbi:DinB family protein [uncultured Polaribacter sp.]|uniref:DinB family protein n=1 Tax=uncultured Polaribacter sp. TaxID=174711 RepID=UPI0026342FD5|nr:DinB family protein [uncultured Polaribacter sp.]
MNKETIIKLLEQKHAEIFNWLENQPKENWEKGPKNKWTSGQHILHLVDSLQLLNNALSYPRFLLKYKFGVSNRPSKSYDAVVEKYQQRLHENSEKAKVFNQKIKNPSLNERERLITKYQIQQKKLQYKIRKIDDKNLDTLILPHPLMGKMTIREIVMWTAHHTELHSHTLKLLY